MIIYLCLNIYYYDYLGFILVFFYSTKLAIELQSGLTTANIISALYQRRWCVYRHHYGVQVEFYEVYFYHFYKNTPYT